jgi:hypothetical protein
MLSIIGGAAVVVISCAFYWSLLPRNGKTHRLVENSDVASMITIGLMTTLTFGVAIFLNGFFG